MEVELLTGLREERESEVDDLHVVVLVDHNIVQFDISMSYLLAVQVLDSHYDPSEDFFGLLLRDPLLGFRLQVLVERGLADILHHEHNLLPGVNGSVELYYIRMIELLQDLDFPQQISPSLLGM